jgi:hypothetical protein
MLALRQAALQRSPVLHPSCRWQTKTEVVPSVLRDVISAVAEFMVRAWLAVVRQFLHVLCRNAVWG